MASEVMELSATVEPMLMRDKRLEIRNVVMMALMGTSQPVGTLENQGLKGTA